MSSGFVWGEKLPHRKIAKFPDMTSPDMPSCTVHEINAIEGENICKYSRLRLIGPLVNRTIRLIGPFSPGRNLIQD